ncbi:hypothetical protein ACFZAC_07495 [Pseudomonas fluorescens]|uniref:hypothetical protein n=1 Tax=Pseudomonas fluorescens TaxID=294 RepID=UPI003747E270
MNPSDLISVLARVPPLETPPKYPGTSRYTVYKPQPASRVQQAVLQACNNGTFVSRCLRVISRGGQSKNFETITGQDGLTFGITDFSTNGGVAEFMELIYAKSPELFHNAFNEHVDNLLDLNWIKSNNAGGKGKPANDNGLIKLAWLRKGLDLILTNPVLRSVQLENFRRGKVSPSLTTFQDKGYVQEFTLATMIGIANSFGVSGMRKALESTIKKVGNLGDRTEPAVAKALLERYVFGDPHPGMNDTKLINAAYSNAQLSAESGLGHRGRRAYWLLKVFPPALNMPFTDLGEFAATPIQ